MGDKTAGNTAASRIFGLLIVNHRLIRILSLKTGKRVIPMPSAQAKNSNCGKIVDNFSGSIAFQEGEVFVPDARCASIKRFEHEREIWRNYRAYCTSGSG